MFEPIQHHDPVPSASCRRGAHRIRVKEVEVKRLPELALKIQRRTQVRATNTFYNFVYPLHSEEVGGVKAFPADQARPEAMLADLLQRLPAGARGVVRRLPHRHCCRYLPVTAIFLTKGLGTRARGACGSRHVGTASAAISRRTSFPGFFTALDAPSDDALPSGSQFAAPAPAFLPSLEGMLAVSQRSFLRRNAQ